MQKDFQKKSRFLPTLQILLPQRILTDMKHTVFHKKTFKSH